VDLSWIVALAPDVAVAPTNTAGLLVWGAGARLTLRDLSPAARAALLKLTPPGAALGTLLGDVQRDGPLAAQAELFYRLQELARCGLVHVTATADPSRLATAAPPASTFRLSDEPVRDQPCVLSRFAYLHRAGEELVLESPLSDGRLVLHDPRAACLLHALATPAVAAELSRRVSDLPRPAVDSLLALLWQGGLIASAAEPGPLTMWEFHDLLFHARSRAGRHPGPFGASWSFVGRQSLPPAMKPSGGGEVIGLYRPDLALGSNKIPRWP
jgi:hypothetical protein